MNAARDFSRTTIKALAARGISVAYSVLVPESGSEMPWANARRAYMLDDNGTGRIRTHAEVLALAAQS